MRGSLAKYKIGLLILSVFTLILLIFILAQAGATKQDNQTYDAANKIADKLNSYVDQQYKVPDSLSAAGINDVPGTVSYQRLSDSKYKFCVNYKTKSANFSAANTESDLLSSAVHDNSTYTDSTTNYDLYLDTNHNKGQNCQTVDAQIDNSLNLGGTSPSNPSDPYAKCDSIQDDTAWENCINSIPSSGTSSTDSSTDSTFSQ